MPSTLISGGPFLNLLCLAQVRHLPHLLVEVVDLCVSQLEWSNYCQIILTASSPGNQLICCSPAINLLVSPPLPLGRVRLGTSC